MFAKHIYSFAASFESILEKMTDVDIRSVNIKRDEQLETTYTIATVAPYKANDDTVEGVFILGFDDEQMAISFASVIAENMGLQQIKQFTETASDMLGEVTSILLGHTISEWEKLDFKAKFDDPQFTRDKIIKKTSVPTSKVYQVKIDFESYHLYFIITFNIITRNKLHEKRILIADDSKITRKIITNALKDTGYEVVCAVDGLEAIKKHKTFRPHLTIMDLVMPKVDGLDAIVTIMETEPDAKFVVLTASSLEDEIVTAKTLNVLDYIIKPIDINEFLVKIRNIIK